MMDFTRTLLAWYDEHGRHDLPWQTSWWYDRLVSEIMLQQTQVNTVKPYFARFKEAFPTPKDLAEAPLDAVYAQWQGLGYYRRAKFLQSAVQKVLEMYGPDGFPPNAKAWAELPGVGLSTAGAISSSITGERAVMMDGNAQRVLARFGAIAGAKDTRLFQQKIWAYAQALLPESDRMPDYTQALMDMGAMLCKRQPLCDRCPLQAGCLAYQEGQPTRYPEPAKKRARPTQYAWVVVPCSAQRVGLASQTQAGVWQGLWMPPWLKGETVPDLDHDLPSWARAPSFEGRLTPITHDFSHYRLILYPVVRVYEDACLDTLGLTDLTWLEWSKLTQVGLPAPLVGLVEEARRLAVAL